MGRMARCQTPQEAGRYLFAETGSIHVTKSIRLIFKQPILFTYMYIYISVKSSGNVDYSELPLQTASQCLVTGFSVPQLETVREDPADIGGHSP